MFDEDKSAVPILSYGTWIATLIAWEAHNANHEGVPRKA